MSAEHKLSERQIHTLRVVILVNRDIGSRCLVLSVYKYPQTEVAFWNLKVGGNPALESWITLVLQHPESRQIGSWNVLVLKGGKIEALVL